MADKRWVMVTGASTGIGRACAELLAAVLSAMIYWILKANRQEAPVTPGASD
jgi:NAD(P)-dependent dehydrogenase (short-subunit alcohol dehydrogenase family)